jgi:hypothetical protein
VNPTRSQKSTEQTRRSAIGDGGIPTGIAREAPQPLQNRASAPDSAPHASQLTIAKA